MTINMLLELFSIIAINMINAKACTANCGQYNFMNESCPYNNSKINNLMKGNMPCNG